MPSFSNITEVTTMLAYDGRHFQQRTKEGWVIVSPIDPEAKSETLTRYREQTQKVQYVGGSCRPVAINGDYFTLAGAVDRLVADGSPAPEAKAIVKSALRGHR
jgi:hypothetical protein